MVEGLTLESSALETLKVDKFTLQFVSIGRNIGQDGGRACAFRP